MSALFVAMKGFHVKGFDMKSKYPDDNTFTKLFTAPRPPGPFGDIIGDI